MLPPGWIARATLLVAPALLVVALAAAPAHAARCTITGTDGDDVLVGTAGRDVICGRGGDDVLFGHGGDDELRGGPGDDVLVGGRGRDRVVGGQGDDRRDLSLGAIFPGFSLYVILRGFPADEPVTFTEPVVAPSACVGEATRARWSRGKDEDIWEASGHVNTRSDACKLPLYRAAITVTYRFSSPHTRGELTLEMSGPAWDSSCVGVVGVRCSARADVVKLFYGD